MLADISHQSLQNVLQGPGRTQAISLSVSNDVERKAKCRARANGWQSSLVQTWVSGKAPIVLKDTMTILATLAVLESLVNLVKINSQPGKVQCALIVLLEESSDFSRVSRA